MSDAPKYDTGALAEEPAERVLWIYGVSYRWSEPDTEGAAACTWCKPERPCFAHRDSPPPGRKWNSSHAYKSYTEPTSITTTGEEFMATMGNRAPKDWADFSFSVELVVRETWLPTWFQHQQPDWGDSNADVLASFMRYVRRIEKLNHAERARTGEDRDAICLMGAEDYWRWHGAEPDGKQSDRSEPPCRCRFCKQFKVVRIGH